jgi:hypothetical protein
LLQKNSSFLCEHWNFSKICCNELFNNFFSTHSACICKFKFFLLLGLVFFISASYAADEDKASNATTTTEIYDRFEDDADWRFAADAFCNEYTLSNPLAQKIVLPYKKNCRFWWQCTTYQLKKLECQGHNHRIKLHYDLYADRCDMPNIAKCNYQYDEEEIIIEAIMEFYKKTEEPENDKKQWKIFYRVSLYIEWIKFQFRQFGCQNLRSMQLFLAAQRSKASEEPLLLSIFSVFRFPFSLFPFPSPRDLSP